MLFNSIPFLFVFLPIVLLGFAVAVKHGRTLVVSWLGFMSIVFYGYWKPVFLLVLSTSILLNYAFARAIFATSESKKRNFWLMMGVLGNVAGLFFFKYLWVDLFNFPLTISLGGLRILVTGALPLGISFFTLTQIAYLVDLAQGCAEEPDFLGYVLFVTFFPHLIAGPILHHREIMPQFSRDNIFAFHWEDVSIGGCWFVMGLAKKVLIADYIAPWADLAFNNPAGIGAMGAWVGALAYAMQLYFDFSGYSDMAVGLARMLSIRLPFNFDSPYKASNIIEFWQRWHMTLTRFLTSYIYNPIVLSIQRSRMAAGRPITRKTMKTVSGFLRAVAGPIFLTMVIAGVWHGKGVQFAIFGGLHGIYLAINHAWRTFGKTASRVHRIVSLRPISVLMTFAAVLLGQIFFRSDDSLAATTLIRSMMQFRTLFQTQQLASHAVQIVVLGLLFSAVWVFPNTQEILGESANQRKSVVSIPSFAPSLQWACVAASLFLCVLLSMRNSTVFLYFQF